MFENVIGQASIVASLRAEIKKNNLPQSLLFYGPAYTGKTTTALELARVISCDEGTGEWQCGCASCQKHRLLISPNLLLLGPRYFDLEIAAAADTLLRTKKVASGFLFIRAVRKLMKRFDPVFAKNEEGNLQKIYNLIEEIEEKLQVLAPEREIKTDVKVEKIVGEIVTQCEKLMGFLKSDNIPIDQVRKIIYWAHFSQAGKKKIIILENIDRMHEASRNALLKLLEEPPANVHLFLLTTQKGAVIKTILSRLRPYYFKQRSRAEEETVLLKIFWEDQPKYESLHYYFLAWRNINPFSLKNLANEFLDLILAKTAGDLTSVQAALWGEMEPGEALKVFAQEFLLLLQSLHMSGLSAKSNAPGIAQGAGSAGAVPSHPGQKQVHRLSTGVFEQWHRIIHEHIQASENLNIDPHLTFESIFYKLRKAVS
jgi:DNA polymerase-3 subunit gamma/tau